MKVRAISKMSLVLSAPPSLSATIPSLAILTHLYGLHSFLGRVFQS